MSTNDDTLAGFAPDAATGWVPISSLTAWDRNPNKHPAGQLAQLAANFRRFGFINAVTIAHILDEDVLELRAGHGRIEALEAILAEDPSFVPRGAPGPAMVRATVHAFPTRAAADAYGVGDNQIASIAEPDDDLIASLLRDIDAAGHSLDGLGWEQQDILSMLEPDGVNDPVGSDSDTGIDDTYTHKIKAPIYEPKGDKPPISALYDDTKTRELVEQIDAADIPAEEAAFLREAAQRHTSFHFARIAEFYCHASPEVQRLMERSALVIVDFDQAIEHGFVKLTERLGALAAREGDDAG